MTERPPIATPDEWAELYDRIARDPGVVFLMGAPDTGKTTLAHYIVDRGARHGLRTAYIDGDLGQSVIGPPTTLGWAIVSTPPADPAAIPWNHLYFIGATSPATRMLETVVGMKRLVDMARVEKSHVTVVDTSGLVAGPLGFRLKFNKMHLLQPRHIVALQRDGEVEHMLNVWANKPGVDIHRLGSTEMAKTRSAEVRWSYRQEKFTEYFRVSRPVDLSLNNIALVCPDLPLLSPERYDHTFKGRVLGLKDADYFTIGLGIWEKSDLTFRRVTVLTPVSDIEAINLIHVGDVTLEVA